MFGKPNFANSDVILAEVDTVLAATATALEAEHPDPSATDAQALVAWIHEIVGHVVLEYGRTDPEEFRTIGMLLYLMRFSRPQADRWEDSLQEAEAGRVRAALMRHVRGSRPAPDDAAAEYYRGLAALEPKPALSAEQFIRLATAAMAGSMERLQTAGYLKVR